MSFEKKPSENWKILNELLAGNSDTRVAKLEQEFSLLLKGPKESVLDFGGRVQKKGAELAAAAGSKVSDVRVGMQILEVLREKDEWKPAVMMSKLATAEAAFISKEQNAQRDREGFLSGTFSALIGGVSDSSKVTCYSCGEKGHFLRNCPKKARGGGDGGRAKGGGGNPSKGYRVPTARWSSGLVQAGN